MKNVNKCSKLNCEKNMEGVFYNENYCSYHIKYRIFENKYEYYLVMNKNFKNQIYNNINMSTNGDEKWERMSKIHVKLIKALKKDLITFAEKHNIDYKRKGIK